MYVPVYMNSTCTHTAQRSYLFVSSQCQPGRRPPTDPIPSQYTIPPPSQRRLLFVLHSETGGEGTPHLPPSLSLQRSHTIDLYLHEREHKSIELNRRFMSTCF